MCCLERYSAAMKVCFAKEMCSPEPLNLTHLLAEICVGKFIDS